MEQQIVNLHADNIDELSLEALQLGVKHFQQDGSKETFILALVADYLKIDLTPEAFEEVKQFTGEFHRVMHCIPTSDECAA